MAAYLDPLYNPVSPPAPLGQAPAQSNMQTQPFNPTQQAMAQGLTGSNPNAFTPRLPVGTGNTMYTGPMFNQEDIANVGGVTSMAPTEDTKAFIPEVESALDKQKNQFAEAGEKGYTTQYDTRGEMAARGAAIGSVVPGVGTGAGAVIGGLTGLFTGSKKGKEFDSGIKAARAAKRDDIVADRKARKEAGLSGKENRQMRRQQRRSRRQAWKQYKADEKLKLMENEL